MRRPKYNFLLPGTGGRWWSGGTETFLKLARFVGEHRQTEIILYSSEEPRYRSLDEVLQGNPSEEDIWVFTTAIDVPILLERLAGRRLVFYLQESGRRLAIPSGMPVLCAARHGMAEISKQAPASPVYFLPNALHPKAVDLGATRDIDILLLGRKTTGYLRDELVLALRERCRVEVVDQRLSHEALLELFNRSKVYLYDSSSSFADGVVEGFGLQPLEALACGCGVVSNLAGGMSDYLEPGLNCHTLRLVLQEDLDICLRAVLGESRAKGDGEELRRRYSEERLRMRLALLLAELEGVPFPRSEAATREIDRHLSDARQAAEQPLHAEIRERGRLIESLQSELLATVGARDAVIRDLQAELQATVGARDAVIRGLQAELQLKVEERDGMIRALQVELHAKAAEWNAAVQGLRHELNLVRGELAATADAASDLNRRLSSVLSSKSWRWTAPLRAAFRRAPGS